MLIRFVAVFLLGIACGRSQSPTIPDTPAGKVLQAWLDEHLPKLVERMVQAEIARIVKPGPG